MAKPKCRPLKITAQMVDGQINSADGIIMFDSVLYHAWFIKFAPQVLEGIHDESWHKFIGLPLLQLGGGRYAASRAVYTEIGKDVQHINRRPDFFAADKQNKLADTKGLISESVGEYRAYRIPNVVRVVKDGILTFYAIGHKDEIENLLSLIPAVGKKYSVGWGMIKKWTVEEIDEDFTTFHPVHGLMRPLPVDEYDGELNYPIMRYAVKPPYWKTINQRLCYVPIVR